MKKILILISMFLSTTLNAQSVTSLNKKSETEVSFQANEKQFSLPVYEKVQVPIRLMSHSSNSCCSSATTRVTETMEIIDDGEMICVKIPQLIFSGSNHQYWWVNFTNAMPEKMINRSGNEHHTAVRIVNNGTYVMSTLLQANNADDN